MADNNTSINPSNVTTGSPVEGGCCYTSFEDSPTLPTTAASNIANAGSGFVNLGELSDQGYTQSTSTTVNKFKGWHGSVILSVVSDEENTFKAEFTEVTRAAVLKLRYGADNVTVDADGFVSAIDPTTVPNEVVPLVFDELFSNGVKQRTVFPRASIDSIDDQAHQKGSLLLYGMTFTANVDDDGKPYYIRRAKRTTTTDDASLSALTVGSLTLSPTFDADLDAYTATTNEATATVTATATDNDSGIAVVVNGDSIANGGTASFEDGANTIVITVTNGSATRSYTVTVTKS